MSDLEDVLNRATRTKLQDYCDAFYDAMDKSAANGDMGYTWSGKTTVLLADLAIPSGMRDPTKKKLIELGCIELLQRGKFGTDTVYALHYAPSTVQWVAGSPDKGLTAAQEVVILRQEVDDLKRQVGSLDFQEAFVNIEQRLAQLETEAQKRGKNAQKSQTSTTTRKQ